MDIGFIVYSMFKMSTLGEGGQSGDRLHKWLVRGVDKERFCRLKYMAYIIYSEVFYLIQLKGSAVKA